MTALTREQVTRRLMEMLGETEETIAEALDSGCVNSNQVRDYIAAHRQPTIEFDFDDEDEDWDDDEDWSDGEVLASALPNLRTYESEPQTTITFITEGRTSNLRVAPEGQPLIEVLATAGLSFNSTIQFHKGGHGSINSSDPVFPGDVIYASKGSGNGGVN